MDNSDLSKNLTQIYIYESRLQKITYAKEPENIKINLLKIDIIKSLGILYEEVNKSTAKRTIIKQSKMNIS